MKYFARRLFHATLLLLAVSIFSFAILQLTPGDFFAPMGLNPQISSRTIAGLRSQYGLDRPLPVRYGHWLADVLKGDLGRSFAYNSPVTPLLAIRARNTLLLTGTAMLLAWLIAIPLGMWSAVHRGKWGDRAGGVMTSGLLAVPDLVLFLVLLLVAVRTGWFPTGGMVSASFSDLNVWNKMKDVAEHLFLPALGLAIATLPTMLRHVRSAMIEVLEAPFIQAARAHGIAERRVLFNYALPVAANPSDLSFRFFSGNDAERVLAGGSDPELARYWSAASGRDYGEGRLRRNWRGDALVPLSGGRESICGRIALCYRSADTCGVMS